MGRSEPGSSRAPERALGWSARAAFICMLLVLFATPAAAQRHQATLEASFVRGAAGYARQVGERMHAGAEIGFGFPQIDRTLRPEQDTLGGPDFEEFLHLGAFLRFSGSEHLEVDAGARFSIADLWPCGGSDCWPAGFLGFYLQPMAGWRNVKFGARLTAGRIHEAPPGETGGSTVVALNPFLVRLTLSW